MNAKIIRNEGEYQVVQERLAVLMDADPEEGTPAADELGLLALLMEDYERRTVPPIQAGPIEAILFRLEQGGLTREDLIPCLGSKSKVSEVLAGKRELSRAMIRRLHEDLGIPLASLFGVGRVPAPLPVQGRASQDRRAAGGLS